LEKPKAFPEEPKCFLQRFYIEVHVVEFSNPADDNIYYSIFLYPVL